MPSEFADEYFDPEMKRFISVEDLWVRNSHNMLRCAADTTRRLQDLKELSESLRQSISILGLREQQAVKSIQEDCESLVMQLRRRESELVSIVTADALGQKQRLEEVLARVETHASALRTEVQLMMSSAPPLSNDSMSSANDGSSRLTKAPVSIKQRFAALCVCEKTLSDSCYYSVPETFSFNVLSKPLQPDVHLALTKSKCASLIPAALTIATKDGVIRCPLPSSRRTAGMDTSGAASVASGVSAFVEHRNAASGVTNGATLPLGIIHYLSTQGGREAFKNTVAEDLIRITCSIPLQVGALSQLVYDRTTWIGDPSVTTPPNNGGIRTKNVKGGRLIFDFSDRRHVRPEAYLLQHGHKEEHAAMRNWMLQGSNDGEEWITLDKQVDCRLLGQKPFNEATFVLSSLSCSSQSSSNNTSRSPMPSSGSLVAPAATDADLPSFRYLSILSTGPNAAGEALHHLELCRVEFFGTVIIG